MCALVLALGCGGGESTRLLDLPPRPSDAATGTALARALRGVELGPREERIYAEIARGNVPDWLRRLRRVEVRGEVDGRRHRASFWVTPDYMAIGSDDDFLIIPVSAPTAQRIADLVGGSLPTPRMVDAIWAAADLRVEPIRIRPDEFMRTFHYFERHNNLIKAQRFVYDASPGVFAAGHKLDVVVTPKLAGREGEVALYGWHRTTGEPIQSLFIGSTDSTVVFSHGLRIVDRDIIVDGVRRDLWESWRDPALAPILSADGVIRRARYPYAP